MNIVLLGPAGSGKGTVANFLKRKHHFTTIAMGNLLTDAGQKTGCPLAAEIKSHALTGELVPDHLVNQVLERRLVDTMNHHVVFDGYPRNLTQAHNLNLILDKLQQHITFVLVLNITKEAILKRIMGRLVCSLCHAVYNVNTPDLSPKMVNICDNDQTPLISRGDDQDIDIIERRLQIYETNHRELIDFYKLNHRVIEINTEQDDVLQMVDELIITDHD